MMRFRTVSLALIVGAMFIVIAPSAKGADATFVAGEGRVTCGTYLERRKEDAVQQTYVYAVWVRGFLTGINYSDPAKAARELPTGSTVLAYLDKHCRENPLDVIARGAMALDRDLTRPR